MGRERCLLKDLEGKPSPDPVDWNRQVRRWRMFDVLIAEIDRNAGNLLVLRDPKWHLVLIDHSRAFSNTTKMVFPSSGSTGRCSIVSRR